MEESPRYYALTDGTLFAVDPPLRLEVWSDELHIIYHDESMERWDYETVIRKLQERHGHLYKMRLSESLVHEVRAVEDTERAAEIVNRAKPLGWPQAASSDR